MTYHPYTEGGRAHLTCDPMYSGPPGECKSTFEKYGTPSKTTLRQEAKKHGWTFKKYYSSEHDLCPNHRLPRAFNPTARGFSG